MDGLTEEDAKGTRILTAAPSIGGTCTAPQSDPSCARPSTPRSKLDDASPCPDNRAMDPQRFAPLPRSRLAAVEDWLGAFDPDGVDYTTADGVLGIEFADGARFVLNRQAGNHQMWFAAGVSAWHFDFDEDSETWRDARDGVDLMDRIATVVGDKLGRSVARPS